MVTKRVLMNFSQELIKEPIIYNLGQQFGVKTNIRRADVTEDRGSVELVLEGEAKQIDEGISWMIGRGVRVEALE